MSFDKSLVTIRSTRFDRRKLVIGGTALGIGAVATGSIAHFGAMAQDATPAATATGSTTPAIVSAANAFLGTLSDDEKSAVLFDFTNNEQRQRWSNFPEGLFTRDGLMWGNLAEDAQNAWLALMQTTLSTEGYNRVLAEWAADQALAEGQGDNSGGGQTATDGTPTANGSAGGAPSGNSGPPTANGGQQGGGGGGGGNTYGMQYYWVAIIGAPSETDPWQWQWGGHHVTINATVVADNVSLEPSFIGVQPATYTDADGNTVRPLGDIEDEAFALINSLDDTQKATAILGDTYVDLVLGPGEDGKVLQNEGLAGSELTDDQRTAALHIIAHYTGLANDAIATPRYTEVEAGFDDTYFAWFGSTTVGDAAYFRFAGPRIVIEYSPQGTFGNAADHVHGIYRDPQNDYGALWTGVSLSS